MKLFPFFALFVLAGYTQAVFVNFTWYDWMQNGTNQANITGGAGFIYFNKQVTDGTLSLATIFQDGGGFWTCGGSCAIKNITGTGAQPNNRTVALDSASVNLMSAISWLSQGTGTVYLSFTSVENTTGQGNLSIFKGTNTSAKTGASIANFTDTDMAAKNYSISVVPGDKIIISNVGPPSPNEWQIDNLTLQGELVPVSPVAVSASVNNTVAYLPTLFSVYWEGNSLYNYTFSLDSGTGTYINDSAVSMTGNANYSNATKVITSAAGATVRYIFYAYNTTGGLGVYSGSYTLTAMPFQIKAYADSFNYTEGAPANITTWINTTTAGTNAYVVYNLTLGNNTGQIYSEYYTNLALGVNNFSRIIFLQNNSNGLGLNYSQNVTVNATLSYGGLNISNPNSSQVNLTVYPILITNCTFLSTKQDLNLTVLNESDSAWLNNTQLQITAVARPQTNTAFNHTSYLVLNTTSTNTNATCIFPQWAAYSISYYIVYSKTGYRTRAYSNVANYSNVTTNTTLYLVPSGLDSEVDFTLKDYAGNVLTNYIIESQRYFAGTGVYLSVSSITTDYAGRAVTYLDASADSYKFVIKNPSGTTVETFTPVVLASSMLIATGVYGITFTLGQPFYSGYGQQGNVAANCTFVNTTNTLTCVYSDATLKASNFSLVVAQMSGTGWLATCGSVQAGTSGVLTCTNSNLSTALWKYQLYLTNPDTTTFIASQGVFDYRSRAINWGVNGYFLAILFVIGLAAIGSWSPVAMMVLVGVGILLMSIPGVGIINMGWGAVVGLLVVIGLLIWKSRA